MALFQYEGIGSLRSLGNRESTQRAIYSYSQFSIVNYEELDYGSIVDAVIEAEDYGEITATIEQYYQIQDFGTITLDTARIPMGKMGIHLAANDSTMRVSVGGVEFALYGRAITTVFFNPVDRVFDFQGEAVNKIVSSWLGRGNLSTVESEGLDVVGSSPATSTLRLKISGEGVEQVIFNPQDRIFNLIGEAEESRTYQYDQDDDVDFGSDDWGFLTEPVLRSENYGLITDLQDIPVWDYSNIEDWGLITENTTNKVYGRGRFSSSVEERFIFATYEGSVGDKQPRLLGTAKDYSTPKINGVGEISIEGTPRVQIRMHYKADGGWDFYPQRFRGGSLFGFDSSTETSVFSEVATAKLFTIKSTTTFKAVRNEVGVSEEDILVRGGADYTVIFNPIDRVFTFRNVEINSRTYDYNESSIVNVEGIDYGYITDTVTLSEDYGFIGNQDLEFPWEVEDFGILDPRETRTPFGLARFYSFTGTPRSRTFIGNLEETHLLVRGSAKIYVLPKFTSKGDLINITSSTTESRTNDEVATGSLFGFSSTTDSTLVQPPIDETQQRIFSFTGELIEKFGKGNYGASGTLFGLSSTTETRLVADGFGELFRITGQLIEKSIFSEVTSGSLFGFDSASETRTFSYNESSGFGACDGEDYGFISESVYNVEESPSLSGFLNTPISDLASEVVSEYGRSLNAIDFGNVNQYYQYNHEDYGNLHPDDCLEPLGTITFRDGVDESRTKVFIGSGSLFGFSSATESILSNPPDKTTLFTFVGNAKESDVNVEIGRGSLFSYVSFTETSAVSEVFTTLFKFSGQLVESVSPAPHVGSGSLFGFSSTTESRVVNPPSISLFAFRGGGTESITPTTEIGSGSIFTFVSFTETATLSENTPQPLFAIDGGLRISATDDQESELKFTFAWMAEGRLFGFDGSGEATGQEETGSGTIFIRDSGLRIEPESFTPWIPPGSGSIFSFVSFTETAAFSENTPQPLFKFSGAATNIQFRYSWETTKDSQFRIIGNASVYVLPKHLGSGEIFIRSSGVRIEPESFTPWIPAGFGSLFGYVGSAEATGSNPPDNITLFNISGAVSDLKSTFSEEKFVQARFSGDNGNLVRFTLSADPVGRFAIDIEGRAAESRTPAPHVGSGSLFGFSSATESRVINPPDKTTLFTFVGNAEESDVNVEIGRGSLFTYVSFTETSSVSETFTTLFRFSGEMEESRTPAPHVGSGSLFGFSSATESRVINPPDKTLLFRFAGKAQEKETNSEVGTGTPGLDINGNRIERGTKVYRGSGSLFGFSSTAEARVIVPPNLQNLFTVRGAAKDSITVPRTGSGSIFGFVGASESKSNVEVNITLFSVTGESINRFNGSNIGVGQIRVGLSNPGIPGDISRGITVFKLRTFPQGPVVKFSGTKAESFTPAPHIAQGLVDILPANTKSRYVEFERSQPTRIIVI
jgi:hypothetical protein